MQSDPATTNGIVMLTFTPLEGMSEVVMGFLPAEMRPQDDS
jgi:phage terminase large subunit-like protein